MVKQTTTIPLTFENKTIIINDVPAEVCSSCNEHYVDSKVTDHLTPLLAQLRDLYTDVTVVSYEELKSVGVMS